MRAIGSNGGLRLFARAVIFGLAAMLPKSAGAETIIYQGILNAGGAPFATLGSQPFPAGTKLMVTATFDTSSANQWSPGAYIYAATSTLFAFSTGTGRVGD
jgi:hypothetical protein